MRHARIASIIAVIALTLALTGSAGASSEVNLAGGPGAPRSHGEASFQVKAGVLVGEIEAERLPALAYGSGKFYGVWFVRSDTGDKAFLGALAEDGSIILSRGGEGEARFSATQFTDGPHARSPIALGPAGTNQIVVLVENNINGRTPSPVGPNPALVGSR